MSQDEIVRTSDVMKAEFDIVDGMTLVQDAIDNMQHPENKCLIVDKRHEDDEFGIVLFSTIANEVLALDRDAKRVNVYEVMTKPIISVHSSMDIRYCARLFTKFRIRRAPVTSHGKIVGIVSFGDLILRGVRGRGK